MTASFVFLAVGRQASLEQYLWGPWTPKLGGNLDFIGFAPISIPRAGPIAHSKSPEENERKEGRQFCTPTSLPLPEAAVLRSPLVR
jgi:hypothetical protein